MNNVSALGLGADIDYYNKNKMEKWLQERAGVTVVSEIGVKSVLHTIRDVLVIAASTVGYAFIHEFALWFVGTPAWMKSFLNAGFMPIELIISIGCLTLLFVLNPRYKKHRKEIIVIAGLALLVSVVYLVYQWVMTGEILFGCDTQFFNMIIIYIVVRILVKTDTASE